VSDAAAAKAPTDLAGSDPKLVVFHRFVPQARLPMRADRSAMGTLPTRAFRYCEAIVTASSFGYYVFSPIDFTLMWDGAEIRWTYEGAAGWDRLTVAQFPHFREHFDGIAPDGCREFSPPFVGALHEPGMVQLWSGLVVRTRPGWSLLVRAPANVPNNEAYSVFEGVVETDRWFGPLFSAVRLTKTNTPIHFRADYPLFQVQPIPRIALDDRTLNDYELVPNLDQLTPEDWDDYYDTVVRPNVQEERPRGQYATAARKRRAKEESGDQGS
jgi:hypothetical protein